MDIKQLKHFIQAYKQQSFTEAAKLCYITPQGLHISINRLEAELGCQLFVRKNNTLSLTEAGKYLLPKAYEIVRLSSEVDDFFHNKNDSKETISVLFVRGTVELIAQPSIARFKEIHPEAVISFRVEQDYDCIQAVRSGEVDMAICAGPIHAKQLVKKHLLTKKNVLVINKYHPLAKQDAVSISDLRQLSLSLPITRVSVRNTVMELCGAEGFVPDFIENDEPRSAFICAEMGLHAGIVNEISAQKLLKDTTDVSILPFHDPRMDWNVFLIRRNDRQQAPLVKDYEECLLNTVQAMEIC